MFQILILSVTDIEAKLFCNASEEERLQINENTFEYKGEVLGIRSTSLSSRVKKLVNVYEKWSKKLGVDITKELETINSFV